MNRSSFESEKQSFDDASNLLAEELVTEPRAKQRPNLLLLFNCLFLLANIAILLFITSHHDHNPQLGSHAFTRNAMKLEVRPLDDIFGPHESLYRGEPRPELDAAWNDLMEGYMIRIPPRDWAHPPSPNNSLVVINDGSGDHIATPAVLHEIHCVKTIRQFLMPSHYPETYERFKPEESGKMSVHIDHCLDMLRQSAMCHGDMTLVTYEWWDDLVFPQHPENTPHLCVNWDRLRSWTVDHSIKPRGSIITNPNTGEMPWP